MRNPERTPPNIDAIISPADGKIIAIYPYNHKTVNFHKGNKSLKGNVQTITSSVASEGYIVSIFMNIFDVHYNRSPINGKIIDIHHYDGKLLPANNKSAYLVNEKTEITIRNNNLTLKVILIAGFIARRIEAFVEKNQSVKAGDILGRINLGSQVTMALPNNLIFGVKIGDKVRAGETIIAKFK